MNLLNDYTRILTITLFEGKLFESVINSGIAENSAKVVKDEMYKITKDVIWQLYMTGTEKEDFLVHVEFNYEDKKLRTIIFFKLRLYDRLFGKLILEQQMKELARLVIGLIKKIDSYDWAQFVLDLSKEE